MAARTLQRSVSLQTTSKATLPTCASRFHSAATLYQTDKSRSNLPAQIDLLERYRGLVTLGRIQEDEEQIRVIMQVCVSHHSYFKQRNGTLMLRFETATKITQGTRRICPSSSVSEAPESDACVSLRTGAHGEQRSRPVVGGDGADLAKRLYGRPHSRPNPCRGN